MVRELRQFTAIRFTVTPTLRRESSLVRVGTIRLPGQPVRELSLLPVPNQTAEQYLGSGSQPLPPSALPNGSIRVWKTTRLAGFEIGSTERAPFAQTKR